jgi:hypothetical protein
VTPARRGRHGTCCGLVRGAQSASWSSSIQLHFAADCTSLGSHLSRHLSTLRILFSEPLAFTFGCEIITNDAPGGRGIEHPRRSCWVLLGFGGFECTRRGACEGLSEQGDHGGIPRVDHQERCGDGASLFQ